MCIFCPQKLIFHCDTGHCGLENVSLMGFFLEENTKLKGKANAVYPRPSSNLKQAS